MAVQCVYLTIRKTGRNFIRKCIQYTTLITRSLRASTFGTIKTSRKFTRRVDKTRPRVKEDEKKRAKNIGVFTKRGKFP